MSRVFTFTLYCTLLLSTGLMLFQPWNTQVVLAAPEVILSEVALPNSGGKYPDIAGYSNTVHVASNPDEKAAYWTKQDSATNWPERDILGTAGGQADYATASVNVGSNGFMAFVWIDRDSTRIYARCKAAGGNFSDQRTVASASNFGVNVQVAVTNSGHVFAVWRAGNGGNFYYSYSTDGCNSWAGRADLTSRTGAGSPQIAAGANGSILATYYSSGQIYAAEWNGSGFTSTRIDRGGNYFADPTVTIGGNGRSYIAWRGTEDNEVWYAEKQADGSWPNSRLASGGGDTAGTVSISADTDGNLHMFWHNNGLQYAYKPITGPWEGPKKVAKGGYNVIGAATLSSRVYGHAVYEVFTGGDIATYYVLVANEVTGPPQGSLVVNSNAALTAQESVSVQFALTGGQANQYQLSNNNQTYTDFQALPDNKTVTWTLNGATGTACESRTVYGRMRQSDRTDLVSSVLSDTISLDPGVDVTVEARNPYLTINPTVYSEGLQQNQLGASDGDPRYTRVPAVFLEISAGGGECSGLKSYTLNDGQNTDTTAITSNVAKPVTLPSLTPSVENNLAISVTDGSDRVRSFTQTIYYDNVAPVVVDGKLEAVDASNTPIDTIDDIVVTLKFTDVEITDNVYGTHGEPYPFWGIFLANSAEPISMQDSAALAALTWFSVPLDSIEQEEDGQLTFEVEWSVFGGLSADDWQGGEDYQIIGAVVDGAGNVSVVKVADVVTLNEAFELPTIYLPLIRK